MGGLSGRRRLEIAFRDRYVLSRWFAAERAVCQSSSVPELLSVAAISESWSVCRLACSDSLCARVQLCALESLAACGGLPGWLLLRLLSCARACVCVCVCVSNYRIV